MKNLSIPVTILLASVVLGGFYYATQTQKQASIERQQQLEIQAESAKHEAEEERKAKEYSASRKNDCLKIYSTESEKWNNVTGWRYNEYEDVCYVRYRDDDPKTEEKCDELYPSVGLDGEPTLMWFVENINCKNGEFENSF